MSRSRTSPGTQAPRRGMFAPKGSIRDAVLRAFAPHLAKPEGWRVLRRWIGTLQLLRPLGGVSVGNLVEIFTDGDQVFEAMWADMKRAKRRVLFDTYTIRDDRVGRRTRDELVAAAQRGCEVVLLYDSFGSHELSDAFLRPLDRAGVRALAFNPMLRFGSTLSRFVRNHKKLLIVDESVGFCGGMNVSEGYAGERLGSGRFRDTHVRVVGPCVRDLADMVERSIAKAEGRRMPLRRSAVGLSPEREGGALVQVLESNIWRKRRAIQKAFRVTLARAVEHCYFTSPYFVPPKRLIRGLRRAAQRGVDVRILTAGLSDVALVRLASQHLYGRLLRAGVRIYEMQGRVLHAKTVTIDGVYGTVGSFNLDHWSYDRNLEVALTMLDEEAARRVGESFLEDLESSEEVVLERWKKRTWLQRTVHWVAYQILRI